jgi:membrane protease YdiL (CAAX protease family)
MIQLVGLFAISWLIVWLFDKHNLSVLGLLPTNERLRLFIILFTVTAFCCATSWLFKMHVAKEQYTLNPKLSTSLIFSELWNNIRGVLTEELLCRGVLLYILIRKLGSKWAIIISSIFFGVLHWLNNGVFGNVIQMSIVFLFTFCMVLLLVYSYAKTLSILIPFAIHFGWNLTLNFIFPDKPQGNHFFILAAQPPIITVSYFVFFVMLLFPKISVIGINYLIVRREKQSVLPN